MGIWKRRSFETVAFPMPSQDLRTPRYQQIAAVLREEILGGRYSHGEQLPLESALSLRFGVSPLTVRRALEQLATQNHVVRRPGRGHGTRVNAPHAGPRPDGLSMARLYEKYEKLAGKTEIQVLNFDMVPAGERVSGCLKCRPDDLIQRTVRLRFIDDEPFSLFTTYVPEDIGRHFTIEDVKREPVLVLVERQGCNVIRAEQAISACLADSTTADLMKTDVGAALINVRRSVLDNDDRIVEYISVLYRPDRYQYTFPLRRDNSAQNHYWALEGHI